MVVDKESLVPNSFALTSRASFVVRAKSKDDVLEATTLADRENLSLIAVGDGTNLLPQTHTEAVILVLELKGMEQKNNSLIIAAGEKWDDCVKYAVERGLSGIEALSGIPGKVGAAPIQNIGAYGTEVGDILEWVEAYDREKKKFVVLNKKDCRFGYRDSLFKQNPGRFIVAEIKLKLSNNKPTIPKYKDVENYFSKHNIAFPTLIQIREAIIEIRKNKLPDPSMVPNCGSFFKNPIVEKRVAEKLIRKFPDISLFPAGEKIKISAGFLIEKAGFKGKKIGKIEIYKNNALVLTNPHSASFEDVLTAKDIIQKSVFIKFGVMLEPEVSIII